jgi:hypothetical protein
VTFRAVTVSARKHGTLTAREATAVRLAERRRCVGIVLAEYGRQRLQGEARIAAVLDTLATEMEHGPRRPAGPGWTPSRW